MRRLLAVLMLLPLLLLAGCGKEEEQTQQALDFRTRLLEADCWANGYIAWSGMEGDLLRVTYRTGYGTDELQADVWFDGGVPARAELSYEGALLLSAELTNFTFEA